MARSKHTTRRALLEEARWDFRDSRSRKTRLEKANQDLQEKRRIKRQVRQERRNEGQSVHESIDVTTIPIRVKDGGRYVHFPAGPEDLRQVLQRLPQGVADGIEAIELTLGNERQKEYVKEEGLDPEVDPFVGRHSVIGLPGVHSGHVLGVYYPSRGLIQLYAYVYDPAIENLRVKETYLKVRFLATFVHEIAHHEDRSMRVSRGRWRFDSNEKAEIYAERTEHNWVKQAVIPFLRDKYGARVSELENWIEGHAQIRIPFEWLCGDPRTTVKGGLTRFVTPISECVEDLLEDVESGNDTKTIRRNLAINVHYGDHYELALEIVETLIRDDPRDLESLTAKADFLNHLDRNEEAWKIIRDVLSADSELPDAWQVQALIGRDRKDWASVLEATTNELRLADRRTAWVVARQARALLELGRFEELGDRVAELKNQRSRFSKSQAFGFEALALLRSGRLDEALLVVDHGLEVADNTVWRHELLGVRFEALCRLGREREASPLDENTLDWLERRGYEDWVTHLKGLGSGGNSAEGTDVAD